MNIISFGFKHGAPPADFVFDVRKLPNPHDIEQLKKLTGLDKPVIDWLDSWSLSADMVADIVTFIWLYARMDKNPTVAIGCFGGRHRSVYVAERIKTLLSSKELDVTVTHRELEVKHEHQ